MPPKISPGKVERWKPERTHATAWLLARRIILHGDCLTTIGGFACEPYRSIYERVSDAELGAALLRVLAEARLIPVPDDIKAVSEKIVRSANIRLGSELGKCACCSVVQNQSEIWILPTRREGRDFTQMLELTVRIPTNSTPEQVGRALRDRFQRCK